MQSRILDGEFVEAGATIGKNAKETLKDADVVLKVRRPEAAELKDYKSGALVVSIMDPYGHEPAIKALAEAGVAAVAVELMPRITRAQVMDVLSSQANLAGYQSVIDAAANYGRALPMMMTAGGYAKPMSAEYQAKQAALVAEHIKKQDIVVTTALIPGRPAPRLISAEMVEPMKPGSVLVDLAVERGGNVEGAKAGKIVSLGDAADTDAAYAGFGVDFDVAPRTQVGLNATGFAGSNLGAALDGLAGVWALAGDTDGVDGLEEIVGAILTPDTLDRAWAAGIRPRDVLADNDGHGFFGALGDAVITRPNLTNVNDFRAAIIH